MIILYILINNTTLSRYTAIWRICTELINKTERKNNKSHCCSRSNARRYLGLFGHPTCLALEFGSKIFHITIGRHSCAMSVAHRRTYICTSWSICHLTRSTAPKMPLNQKSNNLKKSCLDTNIQVNTETTSKIWIPRCCSPAG